MTQIQTDILVIGAGPAGTVSSAYLAQKGYKVTVVEKSKFPRFVIGESLLPRCMDHFEEVGFLPHLEKQGYQHKKGVIFYRDEEESRFDFSEQFTKGKSSTWQVPRADFDMQLATCAQEKGVNILFETGVTGIEIKENEQLTFAENSKGEKIEITSKFVIDSSGYGRVLPRLLDLDSSSDLPIRTTHFAHFKDTKRANYKSETDFIVYLVHKHHYVWNIPFSNGNTSIGFVGENEVFDNVESENIYNQMIEDEAYLKERFGEEETLFPPRMLKGFSTGVKKLYGNGYVLTGNATEFLDPIFSSGVTLATESGLLSAKLIHKQLQGKTVDWQTEYEDYIRFGVDVFKTYINAWYDTSLHDIFFTDIQNDTFRTQICSILAGYVWDKTNPCVKKYKTILKTLSKVINIQTS